MTMMWYLGLGLLLLTAARAVDECRLYLAVSSTSTTEEPKWGVFAGVDFDENVEIGPPDVAVQIHNLMAHAMNEDDNEEDEYEGKSLERKSVEMMERYTWVADSSGAQLELKEGEKINTALPGPALLAAYNGKLTNAAFNHSSAYFRPPLGESPGKTHPGRGASSHFYNVGMRSTVSIPAGHEIFMDYGENFEDEETEEFKLTTEDYKKVDQLVENMIQFMDKYKDELNQTSKMEIYNFLIHDVMSAAAGANKGNIISNILPKNPDDLHLVKEAGGSLVFGSPQVKRDLDYLKKEGFCMDNLQVGASAIPKAGRGAFARRAMQEGTTIAPVPLLHIPDRAIVDMHKLAGDEEKQYRTSEDVVDQQLFLNYCLGHPESSMLFFPAGAIVPLVNHHATKANAKLVWSKHSEHHSHWLEKTPAELAQEENIYIGLLMELVATKDIQEGEEVLLDYGKEWQAAWDAHVKDWDAKVASGEIKSEWPLRALDLNEEYRTKAYKTEAELEIDPYPNHVATYCFLAVKIEPTGDDEAPKPWQEPPEGSIFTTDFLFPCTVKDRKQVEGDAYNYTVVTGKELSLTVTDVPQKAITFMDKPETGDQFITGAFRHAIGIPDDIFPKGPWRDLAKK